MISDYDIIRTCRRYEKEGRTDFGKLSEDEKDIIDCETGRKLCSVSEFAQAMRKKMHCDFESVYYEHPSLFHVIRCTECGTVIFTREDEDYDPNLCCPTCGKYETHFEYWTKEEIEADEKKQNTIKVYDEMTQYQKESYERRQRRGLCDWEICKKTIRIGNKNKYECTLECSNLFSKERKGLMRLKGLNLHIIKWEKDNSGSYVGKKFTRIPLSPYSVYIQWIYPYSKNAHPSLKKDLPWNKKTEKEGVA